MKRLSIVQQLNSKTVIISSVLQIGDSREIISRSKVLAVQRQYELFLGSEGEGTFPIFTKPIQKLDINAEAIRINRLNESPIISVRSIYVIAASTSAVIHIGSTSTINGETRIKHIRQLAENYSPPSPALSALQPTIRITKDE
ncbi:spore germination protein GerPE [Thermaerobacillus caldiproteolyticus]|uniref:spore germination protein GerPE n=1 Tax=Thermaerobacillus caldiproteolyticus TaxID=247480 RepID=UPI0018F185BA|nr:spore germination protein GerPE [Anoxybacillus caldiproteolyticus]